MKTVVFFFVIFFLSGSCIGQKRPIKLDTYINWPEVNEGGISNNGKFVFYQILNLPAPKNTFVVKSTLGSWRTEIVNLSNPKFNESSSHLWGMLPNDTLFQLDLLSYNSKKVAGIIGYEIITVEKKEFIVLQNKNNDLIISDLKGKQWLHYLAVSQYKFSGNGKKLFIEQKIRFPENKVVCKWIDVINRTEKVIFQGASTSHYIFDDAALQAAFWINADSIFYYKEGDEKARLVASQNSAGLMQESVIEPGSYWSFSKDGERIFLSIMEKGEIDTGKSSKNELWSYQDVRLKSEFYDRSGKLKNRPSNHYLSTIRIKDGFVKQLLHGDERVVSTTFSHNTDTLLLVASSFGPLGISRTSESRIRYHLCQTTTGERRKFGNDRGIPLWHISMSPEGKFIIYFDNEIKKYFTYEITTGSTYSLSDKMSGDIFKSAELQFDRNFKASLGISGWLRNDESVILNGTFDLYKVDPRNSTDPVNLTLGIGKKEGIIFNLATGKLKGLIGNNGKLLLSAFNLRNKDFGFYEVSLVNKTAKKLSMNPVYCNHLDILHTTVDIPDLMKARDADMYLFRMQAVDQAPNYFISKDLKTFSEVSDVQPQKDYNWMRSELHTYSDSVGNVYQGVLYKPENFDAKRSYPVVFYYYERKSHLLNSFQSVEVPMANCSVAQLVSNGYLVFLPDMHGDSGFDGEGALTSVISAADHLKQYSWINQTKIGIIGASFGGFETNYIVSHTNRFAAAISGAGISNLLTHATELGGGMAPDGLLDQVSKNQNYFIKNSAVFSSNAVETPLLLLHNKEDGAVNYLQSQSFFLLLRSMQKRVWWLSYEGEGHSLFDPVNQVDFSNKVFDFFGYFLKDGPEPEWMRGYIKSNFN